jgi:hypothetical protein
MSICGAASRGPESVLEAPSDEVHNFTSPADGARAGISLAVVEAADDELSGAVVEEEALQLPHSASSHAIIVRTRTERRAADSAVVSTVSLSRHAVTKSTASTAAQRDVTMANKILMLLSTVASPL